MNKPAHEDIAYAAYWLWKYEGCPDSNDLGHWFAAERMLREGIIVFGA